MTLPLISRLRQAVAAAAVCTLAVFGAVSASAQNTSAPTIEAFFKLPTMAKASLSPSGRWLAALAEMPDKRLGLLLMDLQGKEAPRFVGAPEPEHMKWFEWVTDDWLVFSVFDPKYRGAEWRGSGLMSVKRDGTGSRLLISREYEQEIGLGARKRHLDYKHFFLDLGAPGVPEVVVGEAVYDVRYEYSHTTPKVLNVETGAVRTLDTGAPRADSWWIDHQGRARVARYTTEGRTVTWWYDLKSGKWNEISAAPMFEQPFVPSYIDGDDRLVVDVASADARELKFFDFATGKPKGEPIIATPGFSGAVHPFVVRSGKVLGLGLTVDSYTTAWMAPEMAKLQERVDAKLPGGVNVLLPCSLCEKPDTVVVFSYSDKDPGSYVLFEPAKDKWQLLGQVRPEVDPQQMAAREFHRIKARDGEDLPVWITLPTRKAGAGAPPAVVRIHGGPFVRGAEWEWDAEVQFLASRGYAVIEPEFRGSRGYGTRHYRAGFKQWGHKMQDDISDALKFAGDKGMADARRACIMGGSYGGYAALMGVAKDPDQYRCAVAFAAVSDPRFLYDFHWSDESTEGRSYSLPVTVGDRKKDEALLIAGSPIEQVQRIKAPVLLVHGKLDVRVPIQSAERMADALRKAGKSFDLVVYPDEGHGLFYDHNRYDYYRRVEAFLAKHLK